MKKLLLLCMLGLSGCMLRLDQWEAEGAVRICANKGLVDYIDVNGVKCGNGQQFYFSDINEYMIKDEQRLNETANVDDK